MAKAVATPGGAPAAVGEALAARLPVPPGRSPRRLRDLRVATSMEYLDWADARSVADTRHARRLAGRDG